MTATTANSKLTLTILLQVELPIIPPRKKKVAKMSTTKRTKTVVKLVRQSRKKICKKVCLTQLKLEDTALWHLRKPFPKYEKE